MGVANYWLDRLAAPTKPRRLVGIVALGAAFLFFMLVVGNPNSMIPGIAEATVDGSTASVEFHYGDRYFWLPAEPSTAMPASVFLSKIEGHQTISKRTSFDGAQVAVYDEVEKGTDFPIEANFLYTVSGVFHDATVQVPVKVGSTGKDFLGQIQTGSNKFASRVFNVVGQAPGIIWADLQKIGSEVQSLFHNGSDGNGTAQPSQDGFFVDLGQRMADNWVILVGLLVFLVVAPLLGMDSVYIGVFAGVAMGMAGFWVLAAAAVLVGFLLDNNLPVGKQNFVQAGLLHGTVGIAGVAEENPGVIGALAVFVLTGITAAALTWLGHVNWSVFTIVIGGAWSSYLILRGARRRSGGDVTYRFHRLGHGPALVMLGLSLMETVVLFSLGYHGIGWVFAFFSAVVFIMYANWLAKRYTKWSFISRDQRGVGSKVNARARAESARYGALALSTKVMLWVALALAWLTLAAFASGDWVVASLYLLFASACVAIGFIFVIPNRAAQKWREGGGEVVQAEELEEA